MSIYADGAIELQKPLCRNVSNIFQEESLEKLQGQEQTHIIETPMPYSHLKFSKLDYEEVGQMNQEDMGLCQQLSFHAPAKHCLAKLPSPS